MGRDRRTKMTVIKSWAFSSCHSLAALVCRDINLYWFLLCWIRQLLDWASKPPPKHYKLPVHISSRLDFKYVQQALMTLEQKKLLFLSTFPFTTMCNCSPWIQCDLQKYVVAWTVCCMSLSISILENSRKWSQMTKTESANNKLYFGTCTLCFFLTKTMWKCFYLG